MIELNFVILFIVFLCIEEKVFLKKYVTEERNYTSVSQIGLILEVI